MKDALRIFRFLLDEASRGHDVALLTLVRVKGSSARAIGSHLAVSATGAYAGSFSGGCIEAAIVAEARRVMEAGTSEILRFGAGSPFIDIRLPCGGGIDILVTPQPAIATVAAIVAQLEARAPVALRLHLDDGLELTDRMPAAQAGWIGSRFHVRHDPPLRIVIAGHGEEPVALARQAQAYGADVVALTPDETTAAAIRSLGVDTQILKVAGRSPDLACDERTALVLLFHDHDWEEALLMEALTHPCLYIGAMGSRATHERRLRMLADRGVPASQRARVLGPIGLIPASRDPDTLALSVLAEIVASARSAVEARSQKRSKTVDHPSRWPTHKHAGAATLTMAS